VDNLAQTEAKSSGANAVLHKPVGMDEIRLHLKNFGSPMELLREPLRRARTIEFCLLDSGDG